MGDERGDKKRSRERREWRNRLTHAHQMRRERESGRTDTTAAFTKVCLREHEENRSLREHGEVLLFSGRDHQTNLHVITTRLLYQSSSARVVSMCVASTSKCLSMYVCHGMCVSLFTSSFSRSRLQCVPHRSCSSSFNRFLHTEPRVLQQMQQRRDAAYKVDPG